MIISENLLWDITNRKKKVDEKLEKKSLVNILRNKFKKSIDEEANVHSCRLEYNAKDATEGEIEDMKVHFNYCYSNLKNAWKWGLKNFKPDFNGEFIIEIAKRIEPDEVKGYRENGVRPTGAPVTPPYPAKVPYEMEKLMKNVEYGREGIASGKIHPIELGILVHYHLSRIHPFEDSNGRTSRLIQNLIINNYGFPAAVILKGEKEEYLKHLIKADENYRFRDGNGDFWNNISEGEKNLYDYLASKVNTSIDLVLDNVYKR